MTRIIISLAGILFIFSSCEKDIDPPVASFGISDVVVEPYEYVYFLNHSYNVASFIWDFGDGYVTHAINPSHYYVQPGFYNVKLTAYNHDYVDVSSITIEVISPPPTLLNIQVLEYYQRYPVENASIIIYSTYIDWLNQTNMIVEAITNSDGIAIIEGLAPRQHYYLDVWETNHNNYILANEDVGFITTPYLFYGTITYFTAWVDYVPGSQKHAKSNRVDNDLISDKKRTFSQKVCSDNFLYPKR